MGLLKLFPTLVYQIDASELIDPCVKILNNLLKPKNKKKWTFKVNNATYDKFILKDEEELRIAFQEKINTCTSVLEYKNGFKMTTSWWTRTAPGDIVQKHKHSNCFYSAVFYPYPNAAPLILESLLRSKQLPSVATVSPEKMGWETMGGSVRFWVSRAAEEFENMH